jgi:hypothetical protein
MTLKKPSIKTLDAGEWVKIADNAKDVEVFKKDNSKDKPGYYWTYRPTGDPAPTSLSEGLAMTTPSMRHVYETAIDLYYWAENFDGRLRVDVRD